MICSKMLGFYIIPTYTNLVVNSYATLHLVCCVSLFPSSLVQVAQGV